VDKARITALLEALCERPLAGDQTEPADLQAFCRKAANALSLSGDAGTGSEPAADVDRLTAALAVLLSGVDSDDARGTVEDAVLRSEAARLDAQSAIAFVEATEQSTEAAPADLVEDMLAADRATAATAPARASDGARFWSLLAGRSWSARRWQLAAACIVLVAAGTASWTTFLRQTSPDSGTPPVANAARQQPALPDASAPAAPAPPALATAQPCAPASAAAVGGVAGDAAQAERSAPAAPSADTACGSDHQVADRPDADPDQMMARQRAEAAAREAAAARAAAAGAASRVEAAQADRERNSGAVQADRSGPLFGGPGRNPAAAAMPASPPAGLMVRPAAPFGAR
jgi:hypothetical protein